MKIFTELWDKNCIAVFLPVYTDEFEYTLLAVAKRINLQFYQKYEIEILPLTFQKYPEYVDEVRKICFDFVSKKE